MIEVKNFAKAKHNSASGGSNSVYSIVRTAEEAQHAAKADTATMAEQANYAERAGFASRAAYADTAEALPSDVAEEMVASIGGKHFLSKTRDDVAEGAIRFMERLMADKGLRLGGEDSRYGLDGEGAAVLEDVAVERVHDRASTPEKRVPVGAEGFDLYMGEDGRSHLYIDYMTARVKAVFAQLEIRKVSYAGGTTILSNAGSTIRKVAYVMDAAGENVVAYKCWAAADDGTTRTANWWRPGMMALCATFNVWGQADGSAADGNRRYWRLVVDAGQETLEDGRVYDYVVLSNVKEFGGGDAVVPLYGAQVLTDADGAALTWGGVSVAVTAQTGMGSLADAAQRADGRERDDAGAAIGQRTFWGYEPTDDGGEPDAPETGDVIVQAGDEIAWRTRGNAIVLRTMADEGAAGTAPSVAMYYGMGAPQTAGGEAVESVWRWRELSALLSPGETRVNSDRFVIFSGDGKQAAPLSSIFTMKADAEKLSVKYTNLSREVDDAQDRINETTESLRGMQGELSGLPFQTDDDVTEFKSSLEQTAKGFALEASKETKEGLEKAGIYMDSGKIVMSAGKTVYRDGEGNEVAVFDATGLNADLVRVKHLWATDGGSTVGHFGNADDAACEVDGTTRAPLFVGGPTAKTAAFHVTEAGAVSATAGRIGSFAINPGYLEEGTEGETDHMRLGASCVRFASADGMMDMAIGNSVISAAAGLGTQGGMQLTVKRDFKTGIAYADTQMNLGLLLSVGGTMDRQSRENQITARQPYPNGNHALLIEKGDVAGLRPMLTVATVSRALSKVECVVLCRSAGITLTLPDDAEVGQHYRIVQATDTSGGQVVIKSTKWEMKYNSTSSPSLTFTSRTYMQVTELWFDGDTWWLAWS